MPSAGVVSCQHQGRVTITELRHTECACYESATAHGVCLLRKRDGTRSVPATKALRHTECACYERATVHGVCLRQKSHGTPG